jgi:peptide/nickel transport system ATP-binding protein
MTQTVLRVHNLTTEFDTKRGTVKAVNDVSFTVGKGEILGLVGESGSGKSQTGYSLMNLVDHPGRVTAGQIELNGQDLARLGEAEWRHIRGKRIAMIFQDPMLTLNPVLRIDTQMIEAVQAHTDVSRSRAREIARERLVKVGIASPDQRLEAYPHQFSGGMRQRVAIAIALIHEPEVIIADEPTTALDVTIQEQILFEMQTLARTSGTALIWITHDLSVVAGLADTVAVMYAGMIIERGPAQQVLTQPAHPYTAGLLNSVPARNPRGAPLFQIAGSAPNLLEPINGCAFRPRCQIAQAVCASPLPTHFTRDGEVRCFYPHGSARKELAV